MVNTIGELTNEEKDLLEGLPEASDDASADEYAKEYVKRIIRYETDHYVVDDPHTQDPIIISDEDIEKNLDFYTSVYKDNANVPYINMNMNLKKSIATRKILKNTDLLLYARKEFARVDLGLSSDHETTLADIDTEMGDFIDYNQIKKDSEENANNIKKTDGARLLTEFMIKARYGGKGMSQIDLIIEKLTYDKERLIESSDVNKNFNIKENDRAIHIISKIGTTDESCAISDMEWFKFFCDAIVTDKRAINIAKEINRAYNKAISYVDKIFGPEMLDEFITKFDKACKSFEETTIDTEYDTNFVYFGTLLLFYTLAKKIESNMKSRSTKSLIYRGYIIHYMLDDLTENELASMTIMFDSILCKYHNNAALYKSLTSMQKMSK